MTKGNLLLVEDEEVLSSLLKDLLTPHTDKIGAAYNGLEGIEAIKNNIYHAIVCDIYMPKMNGIEFIIKMRELGHEHPIIFYTGHGNKQLMREALSYGAFDFLAKPHFDNLEDTVIKALNHGLDLFSDNVSASKVSIDEELSKLIKN
jgi:two-component system nitrogen regulation response regulator NtrX